MFVRLKNLNNKNVTLVAHKISDIEETSNGTEVSMDSGNSYIVSDSERVIRSKMLKAFSPTAETESEPEA